jgi:proteasome lid subunit RPN8/RPN11
MEYRNNIRIIILERFVAEVPDEIPELFFNNVKDNNIKEEENDNIKNNDVEEEEESRVWTNYMGKLCYCKDY